MKIYVGVTGLRDLHSFNRAVLITDIRRELTALRQGKEEAVMLNSLAVGADQLCAEIGLELGYTLISPLPFEDYRNDFNGDDLIRFDDLHSRAQYTPVISTKDDRDAAYLAAGKYVADHSDVLLAVWDGQPQTSKCGTQAVMDYAETIQRKIVWIAPAHA